MKKPATKKQIKFWIEKNISNPEWKKKYVDNLKSFIKDIKLREEKKDFPYSTWGGNKHFNFSLIELRVLLNKQTIDDCVDIHYLAKSFFIKK